MLKKSIVSLLILAMSICASAQSNNEAYGHRVKPSENKMIKSINEVGSFPQSDIQYWVGKGTNKVVVVMQWDEYPDESQCIALAWGVKFNGTVKAIDLLDTIATYDSRFTYSFGGGLLTNMEYHDASLNLVPYMDWLCYKVNGEWASGYATQDMADGDFMEMSDGCNWNLTKAVAVSNPNPARDDVEKDYYERVCWGDDYMGHGFTVRNVMADTVISDTVTVTALKDSITNVHISVIMPVYGNDSARINEGETYLWGGQNLSVAGDYTDTLLSAEGCDSIVTLHLTVNQPSALDMTSDRVFSIAVNPVKAGDEIMVCVSENVTVEVIAASGSSVYMFEVNVGENKLPAIGTKGVYFIKFTDRKGGVRTEQIVVE